MLVLGTLSLALAATPADFIRPDAGMALFVLVLVMWFAPKIASVIDILLRPERAAPSAAPRASLAISPSNSCSRSCWCPIMWFGHTIFLSGLLFGREIGWIGQTRDDHAVPWRWRCAICGRTRCSAAARSASLAVTHPAAIPYALFLAAGPALAIPFAVVTALPAVGSAARAHRHRPPARGNRAAARALRAWRCPPSRWRRRRVRAEADKSMLEGLRTARGIVRSLRIYYGHRAQAAAMDRLYRPLRAARRSRVRHRRACGRSRRLVPPVGRARRCRRAAAGFGEDA